MSAPAYHVASQLYYSYRIIRWELDHSYGSRAPSRSYAVSAPAYHVASQLYYSYRIIRWELDHSYGSRAPSRSYAVSAPANPVASHQYCYIMWELILHCTRGEGGGAYGLRRGCSLCSWGTDYLIGNWHRARYAMH